MRNNVVELERLNKLGFSVIEAPNGFHDIERAHFEYLLDITDDIISIDKRAARLIRSIISLLGKDALNDIRLEKFIDTYISVNNANYKILVDWIREIQSQLSDEEVLYNIMKEIKKSCNLIQRYIIAEELLLNDYPITLMNKINIFRKSTSDKVKIRSYKSGAFKFDMDKERFHKVIKKVFNIKGEL